MQANLPKREDINVHDSLNERTACKNFHGKTLDEAEALFRKNSLYYQEDLMWMGRVGFQYYVQAAIRYIESPAAENDSDMINCFVGLLKYRLEHERESVLPLSTQFSDACKYVIEHYERFNVTPSIYGDLRSRYTKLIQLFASIRSVQRGLVSMKAGTGKPFRVALDEIRSKRKIKRRKK